MPYQTQRHVYRINKTMEKLKNAYYKEIEKLEVTAYKTAEPVPFEKRTSGEKIELREEDKWGTNIFDCAWFHFKGKVPEKNINDDIVLLIDINGEGLVVDENGNAVIGLTTGTSAYEYEPAAKRVVPLNLISKNNNIDIWVDGGCNDLFGRLCEEGKLKQAAIAIRYPELRGLYYDMQVLYYAMNELSKDSPHYHAILNTLNQAQNELYDYTEEEAKKARAILKKELDKKGGTPSLKLSAIGHAHIDLAWLWPIRETIRKGARTFSTVMRLMEKYPDYKFGASQPQLFLWIKEYYPALYEQIKERIAEKRFEIQGAMWVEADTNISGGEALVRQVMYGKKYYKDEFGIDVKNVWLPDVFGYSGALPQIMAKSDVPYFMTQKLSWNHQNPFPYHTFNWQGIDGSKVLTTMLPEETYNSPATPETIRRCEKNYREKGLIEDALVLFGIGNGGGGPASHHLERLDRIKNLADFSPIEQRFASDYFEIINKNKENYRTWIGELYFECHRGTYTTQAKNKMYNRKAENALRELEYACVLANDYPRETIEKYWKEVLLYQFHDILPGSSIKRVYDETTQRYETILEEIKSLTKSRYEKLAQNGEGYTLFNSLSFARNEYINIHGDWYKVNLPALGSASVTTADIETEFNDIYVNTSTIENEALCVNFNEEGNIVSIYDKINKKETIEKGKPANRLAVYYDDGDAWDFDIYYDEQEPRYFELTSQKTYIDGPTAIMEQEYSFNNSKLTQKIILTKDSNILVFDTDVDWQETHKMLRSSFNAEVYTTDATCNIQFGNIKRPTCRNTTWDIAKYEISAHKWIDISDSEYGFALLSESKYGFKAIDNILDINLLRSTTYPGENADKGHHKFKYAVYPHIGNEHQAKVAKAGYFFNFEPIVLQGKTNAKYEAPIIVNSDNVIIETIKKAEDSDAIIIRMYEAYGVKTTVSAKVACENVTLCNLVERDLEKLTAINGEISLDFTPYEIKTLKLQ
ncbi:glycoside hydrolase family 38 C-terminal domain-containing protein [Paludicola sp. MB14-C6]|uniref:alpha-mannosidase n=1 Tax=Paludihabitans sp. MB14-C6 TaxID=3070656 RepID=UPI0027DE8279|nr:glycoside hydrolase family 38 C-terminal domain-containing protein [Paludicola sp. MB14-C6]WMJ22356.1 glycoside hydrolase family 38 C-terminal domain-containing protein [Paludicola sp. MB14-C6]